MTNIRRYPTNNEPVFITAVCHLRVPHLKPETAKHLLLNIVLDMQTEKSFSLHAYAVLDDHVHWMLHLGNETQHPMSGIVQSIKLRFTHRLKRHIGATENKTIWQRRFWAGRDALYIFTFTKSTNCDAGRHAQTSQN